MRSAFRPLRSQFVFPTLCLAIRAATQRDPEHFRVLHFSVQFDHVHLVVEAADGTALSSGMRSLVIRMARSVNALVFRTGPFWADRWHGRALSSPRQVRNALLYVLANFRKHARRPLPVGMDAFSSAAWFDGWRGPGARAGPRQGVPVLPPASSLVNAPVSAARTWLGRVGWRKHGSLGLAEAPARS